MSTIRSLALPMTSAVLLTLCFPPFDFAWLAWVALAPLGICWTRREAVGEVYLGAYLGGLLFHLIALDWMRTTYGGVGLSGTRALSWFLCAQVAAVCWPLFLWVGRRLVANRHASMTLTLPLIWIGYEFFRKHFMGLFDETGFPWLQLGSTQVNCPWLIQIADLGGVWAVGFVVAMVNGAVIDIWKARRAAFRTAAGAAICLGAVVAYGQWRLGQPIANDGPIVCLMPEDWEHSQEPVAPVEADLLLWPEMAYRDAPLVEVSAEIGQRSLLALPHHPEHRVPPSVLESPHETQKRFEQRIGRLDTPALIGCSRARIDLAETTVFNSLAFVEPKNGYRGSYDKVFLVPWREFIPWINIVALSRGSEVYDRGCQSNSFEFKSRSKGQAFRVAASICYDTCFPAAHRSAFRDPNAVPDFFAVASCEQADRTLRLQSAILTMARFRAVECRRPIVRNVTEGYSGLIDGNGNPVEIPQTRTVLEPTLVGPIPRDTRFSPYCRYGDWLPIAACVIVALLMVKNHLRQIFFLAFAAVGR